MIPDFFVVLKILSTPQDEDNFTEVQKMELSRLLGRSDTDPVNYKARNFSFSDVELVYMKVFKVVDVNPDNKLIYNYKKFALKEYDEETLSIDEFFERVEGIQKNSSSVCWVTWNGLSYDLPKLNYDIIRKGKSLQLFSTKRYSDYPVFDIMQWLYSWNMANGLHLTCETFGIETSEKYLDKNVLIKMYENKNQEELKSYLNELGSYVSQLFLKVVKYFYK